MSWLSSALTAPGTNAAKLDSDRKSKIQGYFRNAITAMNPALQRQAAFASELEPMRERNVRGMIDSTTPWGVQTGIDSARRGIMSGAMANIPTLSMMMQNAGGGGIGAEQGMIANAINTANMRGNDLQAFWASPEGRNALYKMALEGITAAQSPSILPAMGSLAELVYGRPAPQVGQSPLAAIAGMGASMISGGMFPGLFGGSGGGLVGGANLMPSGVGTSGAFSGGGSMLGPPRFG